MAEKKNKTAAEGEVANATAQAVEENEASEQGSVDEIAQLRAQVEALQAELAAANDKYLRMIAEYDNFRKRSAHDCKLACAEAVEKTLKSILPIGDNLARAAQFSDPASVAKGIELMQKGFTEALASMGIEEIDAKGQPFDPELHNAVMHVEDESLGENVVADVLQKGYKMGDRVLRYAMVTVAN
ncbi:MAG: nucleotide exchange factor GrpE [Clostridia bacterium]|nr:nucleotide exchange factor GrpE [Clostridia bacterium]MBR5797373.1 nucleotide exchange factor GrpE [Clostridia bacterium]